MTDPFLQKIQAPGKKWIIVTNPQGESRLALDSDGFLRDALFETGAFNPYTYCHRPIIVKDTRLPLGKVIWQFKVHPQGISDDVIDQDIIFVWGTEKRVITGADILGILMRGIAIV